VTDISPPLYGTMIGMEIYNEVQRSLKVRDVVEAELATHNSMLPPRWGDLALANHIDAVADWFKSIMRRDFRVSGEDVVLARKFGRGARPLSLLGLQERLLYHGVVSLVAASSEVSPDRSFEAYSTFQRAPLETESCSYVFKTDIAAYYQYIDHERLVDEVVAQTGDDLAVSVAVNLLHHVMGRNYGLPQLSRSSDVLAEIYIEPMRRNLVRGSFAVFRFADDFRIACRTYEEALSAWEASDGAARELGLVLNESKTSTPSRSRYANSLTAVHDRERELFDELEVEGLDEPEYMDPANRSDVVGLIGSEEPEEEEAIIRANEAESVLAVSDAQVTAATEVLNRWLAEEEDEETQRRESAHVTATLLGRALRVLAVAHDERALESVTAMLVYEPSLTPTIARYLSSCRQEHPSQVRGALDEICRSDVVNAWQAVWIAYVAGSLSRRRRRGADDPDHVTWLRKRSNSSNSVIAAEAMLALARRHLVSTDEVSSVLNRLSPVQRPTGVVALGALGNERYARDAAPSELDRFRVAWASENL